MGRAQIASSPSHLSQRRGYVAEWLFVANAVFGDKKQESDVSGCRRVIWVGGNVRHCQARQSADMAEAAKSLSLASPDKKLGLGAWLNRRRMGRRVEGIEVGGAVYYYTYVPISGLMIITEHRA
jgi:hypothetical protein